MMMMLLRIRIYYVAILTFLTFFSCKNENTQNSDTAFFGGEIINPNSDFLVLKRTDVVIDTIYLDRDNRFNYIVENLDAGLHYFYHGDELQTVLLEPKDSILLRLNTSGFDESLVYTGKGAKKNNYLINLFLKNEEDNESIYKLSQLVPEEFQKKLDSIHALKSKKYLAFKEKHETSELFETIAKGNIDYSYYSKKEIYPFRYFGDYNIKNYKDLPENFYNYRSKVDYNSNQLNDLYPYYSFLFSHFNNLALGNYFSKSNDSVFNRYSLNFNLAKLQLIDSLVSNSDTKNMLLKYETRNFINNSKNENDVKTILDFYLKASTDNEQKDYIEDLYQSITRLKPGNKFPKIEVLNSKNNVLNIESLITKPTVVSFWSFAIKSHFKENQNKLKVLKEKFPEINFISINVNTSKNNNWQKMLKRYNYSLYNQYSLKDRKLAKEKLALHYINKAFIIDKNKAIVNANANLFASNFEEQLQELLKK